MADPSPLDYNAYRDYLKDWFVSRKQRPSMEGFGRRVGVSRQLVSSICLGKRNLGEERAPIWADRLGLQDLGRTYFLALVSAEEGATAELRQEAFGRIRAMRAYRETRADQLLEGLATRWLRLVIHEMAQWPDFQPRVEWLIPRIRPKATPQAIQEALNWLLEAELLGPDRQQAANAALASAQDAPPGALTQALARHHFELLDIAHQQLPNTPPKQRSYLNVMSALSAEQFERIKAKLEAFQRHIYEIASEPTTEPIDRVYALSLQLFPMAMAPDDLEEPTSE